MSVTELPALIVENTERHFQVSLFRCMITGKLDKCIRVKLCEIPWNDDDSGRMVELYGMFSEDGLRSLLTDLQAAPPPLELPTPESIRNGAVYQWAVTLISGETLYQFEGEKETAFGSIDCGQVRDFYLLPRDESAGLPSFLLSRTDGFWKTDERGHWISLELPFPSDGQWQYNYYRRVSISFTSLGGENELWPTHVKQVLGWQVGDPEDPTILEIAVEDDGSWQPYQKRNVTD